jgi:hypothetical protein
VVSLRRPLHFSPLNDPLPQSVSGRACINRASRRGLHQPHVLVSTWPSCRCRGYHSEAAPHHGGGSKKMFSATTPRLSRSADLRPRRGLQDLRPSVSTSWLITGDILSPKIAGSEPSLEALHFLERLKPQHPHRRSRRPSVVASSRRRLLPATKASARHDPRRRQATEQPYERRGRTSRERHLGPDCDP